MTDTDRPADPTGPARPQVAVDTPFEGVVRLTLDRPPVNALGREFCAAIAAAASAAARDPALRVVLLAARGKAFCAGADLKERAGMDRDQVLEAVLGIRRAVDAVAAIPVPTIAVLNGAALGGGFELALACDLRIAAEDAPVGLPECSLAIIPGAGGTQRLLRLCGPGVARRWVFGARAAPARDALRDGLVDAAVAAADLEAEALRRAADIARCGPVALRAAKRALDDGLAAGSLAAGLDVEWRAYQATLDTEDRVEALRAFAEKRAPRFTGR